MVEKLSTPLPLSENFEHFSNQLIIIAGKIDENVRKMHDAIHQSLFSSTLRPLISSTVLAQNLLPKLDQFFVRHILERTVNRQLN